MSAGSLFSVTPDLKFLLNEDFAEWNQKWTEFYKHFHDPVMTRLRAEIGKSYEQYFDDAFHCCLLKIFRSPELVVAQDGTKTRGKKRSLVIMTTKNYCLDLARKENRVHATKDRFAEQIDFLQEINAKDAEDFDEAEYILDCIEQYIMRPQFEQLEEPPFPLDYREIWLEHRRTGANPRELTRQGFAPSKSTADRAIKAVNKYIAQRMDEILESLG